MSDPFLCERNIDKPCGNCGLCLGAENATLRERLAAAERERDEERALHDKLSVEHHATYVQTLMSVCAERDALALEVRTVRAKTLEEAAKVVDDLDMPDMWDGSVGRTDDGSAFRRNAVAAIRALAALAATDPKEGGT